MTATVTIVEALGQSAVAEAINNTLAAILASNGGAALIGTSAGITEQAQLDAILAASGSGLIKFQRADTGSVIRTLLSKLSDIVSVKDFGAVGDGSTDDYAVIQAAITAVQVRGGGILFFPAGNYRVSATLVVNAGVGVHLMGENLTATAISTVTNTALLTLDGTGRHTVEEIQLIGYGIAGGNGPTTSGSAHTLWLKSNCVDVKLSRVLAVGGWYAIRNDGTDTIAESVIAYGCYGPAIVYNTANALWLRRAKIDNAWPVSIPSAGVSTAAWAATTAYNIGDVRSSAGFYMQCRIAGTSGGSAPTLQNYGTDIIDGTGTLRWRLCCNTSLALVEITTSASETHIEQADFSGAAQHSVSINNNGAGVAPWATYITDSVFSQTVATTVDCVAGNSVFIKGGEIYNPIANGESAVAFRSAFAGDSNISDTLIIGSSGTVGVYLGSGSNYGIHSTKIFGALHGIMVEAGVSKWTIGYNDIGSSTKWGANTNSITVNAGASDYYNITNNNIRGFSTAGVTDGGTGTHKTLSGNN